MPKHKPKTVKSFSKRFKLTKTGKIKKLAKGKNHFNAKETSKRKRNKRRDTILSKSHARTIKKIINF